MFYIWLSFPSRISLATFFSQMTNGLDPSTICRWSVLIGHPDTFIVSDFSKQNIFGLLFPILARDLCFWLCFLALPWLGAIEKISQRSANVCVFARSCLWNRLGKSNGGNPIFYGFDVSKHWRFQWSI